MIFETTSAVLGSLLVYQVYMSHRYGQDFIGDLVREMRKITGGLRITTPTVLDHPATHGVATRQLIGNGGLGARDLTDWSIGTEGRKKEEGGPVTAELPPRVGNPSGGPGSSVDAAIRLELPEWASAYDSPAGEPWQN